MLLLGSFPLGRSSAILSTSLGEFLFLLLLLGLLLDAGELAQDFYALFRRFPAACKLHGENLLDDLIEFFTSWHAQCLKLVRHSSKGDANWTPFIEIGADFGERAGVIRLCKQKSHLIERKFLEETISIHWGIHITSNELLLGVECVLFET